ncbi:MAG: ribokinaselike protein [Cryobacterium sp.]|jgi:fructoselysine 6-kinase|nr:ribokinaselike protein [Cryobacterium sp.]
MVAIVAVGDNVVDCYPALHMMFPGGNSLNVSVFARRAGAAATYIGSIAPDAAGDHIRAALSEEGVNVARLRTTTAGDTAYCIIGHRDGDRVFLHFDLGVSRFEPDEGDLEHIGRQDAVHVSQSSGLDHRLAGFARRARLSYDFSTRRDAAHLTDIAPHCFLASFSGSELGPAQADELAAAAHRAGAEWALVTRGERGAMLVGRGRSHSVPAVRCDVVDTLGAGDTVIARVLVGLVGGEDPAVTLTDAVSRAADTCTRQGAFGHAAALPDDLALFPPFPS